MGSYAITIYVAGRPPVTILTIGVVAGSQLVSMTTPTSHGGVVV